MSKYIIIGAGAVGASLAAQFEQAGVPYVLVGRGEHFERIRTSGLRYRRPGATDNVALRTADGPADVVLDDDDVLIVATKSQDVERAISEWAWQPVGPSGAAAATRLAVVTLQNGLDAERIALRRFANVYGGSLLIPARFTEPGEVVVGSSPTVGVITLGRYPSGTGDQAEAIAADLRRSGYAVQVSPDVTRWKAAKILHSVKNGLEVLHGNADEIAAVGQGLTDEARQVLAAAGIDVADTQAERTVDLSGFGLHPDADIRPGQQSTWQSFARQASSSEIDHLNGEIVLLGRLHGIETPYNTALQALLNRVLAAGDTPGSHSVGELTVPATTAA